MRCYSDQWNAAVPYGLAGIIVYVIGIPLYYSALLYVIYQKSYQGTFWRQAKEVVPKIMTFEHIYKPEKQRFILVQLLQKFCLIVVSMFFSSRTGLQIVLTQAILLVCLLLYFRFKPYKYTVLNILEVASIICSMSVLGLGLPFHIDNFKKSGQVGLIFAMLFLIFAFILAVICASIYEIQNKLREIFKGSFGDRRQSTRAQSVPASSKSVFL
ncbi:hypothetical protein BKA69DRAFT_593091 [Paraphysoderma sedebokerense]|nr:hypothetical protein BKA69DRAFT_593091 [Paraphysoderma sedebokerense]